MGLEAVLAELDALGLKRTAIDVCMALERVQAHIAAEDPSSADPRES